MNDDDDRIEALKEEIERLEDQVSAKRREISDLQQKKLDAKNPKPR